MVTTADSPPLFGSRPGAPPLVLASGSTVRRALLAAAGVPLAAVEPASVDEGMLRESLRAGGATTEQAAHRLASAKAEMVATRHPGALVLGADQMLETAAGDWLEKPAGRAAARGQLQVLRGTTHRLVSAAILVRDGRAVWQAVDDARLTMRPFGDDFLETYLDAVGPAVTSSVGGYHLEGLGVHLFSCVAGDHFTILGLPMLPLLTALRSHGVSPT